MKRKLELFPNLYFIPHVPMKIVHVGNSRPHFYFYFYLLKSRGSCH